MNNGEINYSIEENLNTKIEEEINASELELERLEREFEKILFQKKQNLDKELIKNAESHIDPEISKIISEIDAIV